MDIKKIRLSDDYIRLGLICLFLVIIYLFIVTPLKLNRRGYLFFQDLAARYAYRLFYATHKSPDITIIAVDDTSLSQEHLKWPWPRAKFAGLVNKISSHRPKVIALDIIFTGESSHGPEDDNLLAEAIRNAENVVLASTIGKKGVLVDPLEEIGQQASAVGLVNKIKDEYSVVRSTRAVVQLGDEIRYSSFELDAVALYNDIALSDLKVSEKTFFLDLFLGRDRIKLNRDGTFAIKYTEKPSNFNIISASDILKGDFDPALIRDRLVMVGFTAESLHDIYLTPLGSMPGVVLSANVVDNILKKNILQRPGPVYMFLIFLVFGLFIAYAGLRYPLFLSFLITTIMAGVLLFIVILGYKDSRELDLFGIIILLYVSLGSTRFYLYIKSYIEKSKMLNLLTIDQDSSLYNIYYLLPKLQQQLELTKDKRESPALIVLGILDSKARPLSYVETETKRELVASAASIIREHAKPLNGLVARTGDFEFGIMVPRYKREHLDQFIDSIYQRMDNLKLLLSRGQKSLVITAAIGVCHGSDLEEKSAELMVYTAHEAIDKASGLTDKRICVFDAAKEKISSYGKEKPFYATEGTLVDFVVEDIRQRNKQLLNKIEGLNNQINDLRHSYLAVISSLVTALEEKDVYTAGHSERVAGYSTALAERLDVSDSYKDTLKSAAMLHDIGKIGIPDSILHKKGALTEDEKEIIKRHEIESTRILEPVAFLKDTIPIIMHHHEHYDGGGYPHGLTGERIPLGARIMAIADAFDAMTSGRSYNRPMNTEEAIAALRENSGTQFDSDLIAKFIEVVKESSARSDQK